MSRTFRLFAICYAAAMVAIAASVTHHNIQAGSGWLEGWVMIINPALCYVLLAIGFILSKKRENSPRRLWLRLVFALTFSFVVFSWVDLSDSQTNREFIARLILSALLILSYIAISGMLIRRLGSKGSSAFSRTSRIVLPLLLMAGAALVLSSLFLETTEDAPGWRVIAEQKSWITGYYNVGAGIFGPTIHWLQLIFAPAGFAFYLLGLAASLALIVLLLKSRFSLERMNGTALFARLTALISLVSLWVVTDIFWGWHFDLSDTPWAAAVAAGCWLGALIFGAVLLLPVTRGDAAPWRFRALLVFELPIVAFNLMILPTYFESHEVFVHFPGLGLLIVGALTETWACMGLLTRGEKAAEEVTEISPVAGA